jgi:hypothetical protein
MEIYCKMDEIKKNSKERWWDVLNQVNLAQGLLADSIE